MMRAAVMGACMAGLVASQARAQDSTAVRPTVSGFLDAYYAWDPGRPPGHDRPFVTQPARANEFNLNLAHIALSLDQPRFRARVALQAGTSVQANYAAEPRTGSVSGPDLVRHIQEATVGVRAAKSVWVDAGIYLSYIGWEGWVSAGNPTYTRSMVAEFSPYYLSGARVTWTATPRLTLQAHLMNGWQIVSENNESKALGFRADYTVSKGLGLVYAAFVGNEQPAGTPATPRIFQQVMARGSSGRFNWQGQFDLGRESRRGTSRTWYGGAAIGQWAFAAHTAAAVRFERYSDPDQAIVATHQAAGLVANGWSAGVDRTVAGGVLWRTEVRQIHATTALFPESDPAGRSKTSASLVTSLAVTF